MSFNVGDPIFNHRGQPGVVVASEPGGRVKVDQNFPAAQTHFRHGYVNGLGEANRTELNGIMDEVAKRENVQEKIELLQNKIAEYEKDMSIRSRHMLGYLKSELSHVMNSYGETPRYYEIPASRAP